LGGKVIKYCGTFAPKPVTIQFYVVMWCDEK